MRQLSFGNELPGPGGFERWARDCFREIEQAAEEDAEAIISEFQIAGAYTETRTLTPATATLSDLVNFVATLVSDIQKGGQKRDYV